MNALSIRFLIGLSSSTDRRDMPYSERESLYAHREQRARMILANYYNAFGAYRGSGSWKGLAEPCLMVETIVSDSNNAAIRHGADVKAHAVARELAAALDQDAVAVVFAPVQFELLGPAPAGWDTVDTSTEDAAGPRKLSDSAALDLIAEALDGVEWDAETLDTVACIVRRTTRDTGRVIRDPDEVDEKVGA